MRTALALVLAAAAATAPAAADAARHHRGYHARHAHRHHAHKRHHRDEQVRMPPHRRPPVKLPPPVEPPAPKPLGRMQVVAREFTLTLSRTSVAAGTVSIELDNRGQDPHDLRVQRADDPLAGFNFTLTKPGTFSSQKLELGPGTWKLYCTLEGHAALGMSATVTVTG